MIFETLTITAFGKLSDKKIDFTEGVNIIEGANESGKSTICAFIRFMFYGLPKDPTERARAIRWQESRAKGSITFFDGDERYRIEREAICVASDGERPSYREKCNIFNADTGVAVFKGQSPGEVFFGVSDLVFSSTVYIRQTAETKVGGHELGEEAENILFSGNESINTKKAISRLDSARLFLYYKNRRGGKIAELQSTRDEIAEKLEIAKKESGDIIYLEGTSRQIAIKRSESEERLKAVKDELEQYECYTLKKAYEKRRLEKVHRAETDEKIAALKSPPEHGGLDISSDNYIASLEKMQSELELSSSRYSDAEAALAAANRKLADMSEKLAIFERFGAKGGKKREELVTRTKEFRAERSKLFGIGIGALVAALIFAIFYAVIYFGALTAVDTVRYVVFSLIPASLAVSFFFFIKSAAVKRDILTICRKFGCADYGEFEELVRAASEDEAYMVFITGARDEANDKFGAASKNLEQISADILNTLGKDGFEILDNTASSLSDAIAKCREIRTELVRLDSVKEAQTAKIEEIEERLSAYSKEYLRSACLAEYDEEAMENFHLTEKKRDSEFLSKAIASQTERMHQLEVELSALTATVPKPTELAEQKASLDAEIENLTAKWEAYVLAIETIEKASGKLREGIAPKIAKSAARLMSGLTDGKYSDITVDPDFGLSFSDGAMTHDIELLSAGTGDLAYISLRIALIELLYQKSIPPFLFDESFVRMDETRLSKMLSLIKKYSERHFQSILFTCHARERNAMKEIGECNILTL